MKNLRIDIQLMAGFTAMILLVMILAVVAYQHTSRINLQTEMLFNHPLKVRSAIGTLESDIMTLRLGQLNLMLAKNGQEKQEATVSIKLAEDNVQEQFKILNDQYLGPHTDIEEANKAYVSWRLVCKENSADVHLNQLMTTIDKIDLFAKDKAVTLLTNSQKFRNSLNKQLILLVFVIILLSILIAYFLIHSIRQPVGLLTNTAIRFKNGERNARCIYQSQNEFGLLSDSFNSMIDGINENTELNNRVSDLAALMLREYDPKRFFQSTLNALAEHTGSQMAAIYLLSDDKTTFVHFESIGMDDKARQSFDASTLEGEFGSALVSQKIQHLKEIAKETRFIFHTVSGSFIPREIITIPILADNEVVAIISLASVNQYHSKSKQLIDRIHVTLCTRIEGILSYHKMKEFSQQLEVQNHELEAQKSEMASQSSELLMQNTELEMQKTQLNEASQLKTNFLSNMSHELRTPLNSVIALSGVLNRRLDKKIPDEEYSYLEIIERNGKHLLSLINDILDISRIEAGHEEIEITKFNLSNLIADLIAMINPQAEQKKIKLFYTGEEKNLFVISDFDKCHHILQNLISNAVKFTEEGKVEIITRQTGHNTIIEVIDTGIGIAENHLPHIFDEFRQADGSTSRRFGGTGLGLAIAKKYAILLGGSISVSSTPGKGSTFTLNLPLSLASEDRLPHAEAITGIKYPYKPVSPNQPSTPPLKTILLVEDSEPAIIQIKDILEGSGFRLLVAHDGCEALKIIANTIPDAIILDLMMPVIDGFEVLKTLREAEPTAHIPVLILSAKQITKEELRFLKRNNVHQLIQKGEVNRLDLLEAINALVFQELPEPLKPLKKLQNIEGNPVVLVVEDNPDNMVTVKAMLANDYIVLEAIDGPTAIEMAKKYKPNLILMDVALPGMDGIEAFKIIRNDAKLSHIAIIALTASAMTSDRETILAHGLDAYIAKPIDEKLFFKTISSVLYGK